MLSLKSRGFSIRDAKYAKKYTSSGSLFYFYHSFSSLRDIYIRKRNRKVNEVASFPFTLFFKNIYTLRISEYFISEYAILYSFATLFGCGLPIPVRAWIDRIGGMANEITLIPNPTNSDWCLLTAALPRSYASNNPIVHWHRARLLVYGWYIPVFYAACGMYRT